MNTFLLIGFLVGIVGFIVKKAYDSFANEFNSGNPCKTMGKQIVKEDDKEIEIEFQEINHQFTEQARNTSWDSIHFSNLHYSPCSPIHCDTYFNDLMKNSLQLKDE